MRFALLLVILVGCGSKAKGTPPRDPVDNEVEAPPAPPAWWPTEEQRIQLEVAIEQARTEHAAGETELCVETLATIEPAWLGSELDEQVLAVAQQCAGRTETYCDYYTDLHIDGDPYCALKLEVELAPRRAYADAVAAPCGFGSHDPSVALPGEPDRCVAVEWGTGAELEDLDDEGQAPPGSCARLVVLERDGAAAKVVEVTRTGDSFLDDVSDCCHATVLAASRTGEVVRVVLTSDGPSRDCFGGTASMDEFEVYRLEGARLEMEAQLQVGMH